MENHPYIQYFYGISKTFKKHSKETSVFPLQMVQTWTMLFSLGAFGGWLNAFGVALGVLGAPLDAVAPLGLGVFLEQ